MAKRVDRTEVQKILRLLELHAPTWIATIRAYIAQLERAAKARR